MHLPESSLRRLVVACSMGLLLWGISGGTGSAAAPDGSCTQSAINAKQSCDDLANSEYWLARSKCANLTDPEQRRQCRRQARQDREEAFEECEGQLEARLGLCE